jgi:hypothetical protein
LALKLNMFSSYRREQGIAETLGERDPGNTDWQQDLLTSYEKLGSVYVLQGDVNGALSYYAKEQGIAESLAKRDPDNTDWQWDLAVSYEKMGEVALEQGDGAKALASCLKAQASLRP